MQNYQIIILILLAAGVTFSAISGLILRYIDIRKASGTVIAEYEAPHLLTPAELGFLFDKHFGDHEFLATAVGLVQKGFIKLETRNKSNPVFFINENDKLTTNKTDDTEKTIIAWLKVQEHQSLSWNELSNLSNKNFGAIASFKHEVRLQLAHKGYLYLPMSIRPQSKRDKTYAFLCTILLSLFFIAYIRINKTLLWDNEIEKTIEQIMLAVILPIAAVLFWFILYLYFRIISILRLYLARRPVPATDLLSKRWRDIAGYEEFIRTVEYSRLTADTNIYDEAMPYAIALGFKPDIAKLSESYKR